VGCYRVLYRAMYKGIMVFNVPSRYFFFFSSRRRHTRSKRDWSSDVCSSDLLLRTLLSAKLFKSVENLGVRFYDASPMAGQHDSYGSFGNFGNPGGPAGGFGASRATGSHPSA